VNDDRLEENLLRALAEVTAPPEVPRAAMWERIASGLRELGPDRVAVEAKQRRRSPWAVVLQVAAVLAIGIAVGRATVSRTPGVRTRIDTRGATSSAASRPAALSSILTQHLSDAEVLLTEFRNESGAAPDLAMRAGELLSTTRHLLDAPAARDPELHAVLEDLELVLAQLARLQSGRVGDDAGFVHETLDQRGFPGRLHLGSDRGI